MKSKAQEIQILRDAITTLGADTYLGPWLGALVDEVERDIRGDLFPCRTLRDTQAECNLQMETTNRLCREHKESVRKECEKLLADASKQCDSLRGRCGQQLYAALREINL